MYQRQDLLLSLIAGNLFAHGAPMQLLQHLLSRSSCITDLQTYGINLSDEEKKLFAQFPAYPGLCIWKRAHVGRS